MKSWPAQQDIKILQWNESKISLFTLIWTALHHKVFSSSCIRGTTKPTANFLIYIYFSSCNCVCPSLHINITLSALLIQVSIFTFLSRSTVIIYPVLLSILVSNFDFLCLWEHFCLSFMYISCTLSKLYISREKYFL